MIEMSGRRADEVLCNVGRVNRYLYETRFRLAIPPPVYIMMCKRTQRGEKYLDNGPVNFYILHYREHAHLCMVE